MNYVGDIDTDTDTDFIVKATGPYARGGMCVCVCGGWGGWRGIQ